MTTPEDADQRPPAAENPPTSTHSGQAQPPPQTLEPPPGQPHPPLQRARGLAIAALVVGIAAALAGWAPILGAVIGVVAIILAVVALVKKQSKPLAVTGLVLGALATVTSLVITLTLGALGGNLLNELGNLDDSADGSFEVLEPDAEADPDEMEFEEFIEIEEGDDAFESPLAEPEDAPVSTASGTGEDPHSMGTRLVGEEWDFVLNSFTLDATDRVLQEVPDATPPADGKQYALVNVTVFYKGEGNGEVRDVDLKYNAPGRLIVANNHRAHKKATPAPEPRLYLPNMQISGHYTGNVIFEIPEADTPGSLRASLGFMAQAEEITLRE